MSWPFDQPKLEEASQRQNILRVAEKFVALLQDGWLRSEWLARPLSHP